MQRDRDAEEVVGCMKRKIGEENRENGGENFHLIHDFQIL